MWAWRNKIAFAKKIGHGCEKSQLFFLFPLGFSFEGMKRYEEQRFQKFRDYGQKWIGEKKVRIGPFIYSL